MNVFFHEIISAEKLQNLNGENHQPRSSEGSGLSLADSGCSGSTSGGLETKSAVARLAQAGALLTAASWATSSWDRDVLCSGLQGCAGGLSTRAGQPFLAQSSQGGECMKTSATIEDFRPEKQESKAELKVAKAVTLAEGQNEDNNKVLG